MLRMPAFGTSSLIDFASNAKVRPEEPAPWCAIKSGPSLPDDEGIGEVR